MPPDKPSFDLTSQPWIPVIDADGQTRDVSLSEALLGSHEILDLVVETPTLEPPLLRMMLAILSRAFNGPATLDDWESLWKGNTLPTEPLHTYLGTWRHSFDLFDLEAPFMQAAGLQSDKGDTKSTAALLPHWPTGHNAPLFILATADQAPALTPAEAARWLLHLHAWDTAGLKTAAHDDPTSKGRSYGNPTGPLGSMNVVIPKGKNLRETLLLNLIPRDQPVLVFSSDDLPVWERPPMTGVWAPERTANGPCEVFTWPSRRVRLIPHQTTARDVRVAEVVVTGGDRLDLTHLQGRDPHAAWKRSQATEKKQKRSPIYRPVMPQPDRYTWENLDSLLALHDASKATWVESDAPTVVAPACLRFLGRLEDEGILDPARFVVLRTAGVIYGPQSAVVEQVVTDVLPVPLAVWSGENPVARQRALRMVAQVVDSANALASFARTVAEASGDSEADRVRHAGIRARRALYRRLDPVFRRALSQLVTADPDTLEADWVSAVRRTVQQEADLVESEANPRAYADSEKSVGRAFGWLQLALSKALPTHPGPQETT